MEKYHGNTVEYWKQNAEENYLTTPISVLKYITVLEEWYDRHFENDQMLSARYLMVVHPEINNDQAERLLIFCKERTISHKECYGDGSIMYPMWKESNAPALDKP